MRTCPNFAGVFFCRSHVVLPKFMPTGLHLALCVSFDFAAGLLQRVAGVLGAVLVHIFVFPGILQYTCINIIYVTRKLVFFCCAISVGPVC